MRKNTDFRPCP